MVLSLATLSSIQTANADILFLEDFEDVNFGSGSGVGQDAVMFTVSNGLFHDGGSDYFHSTAAGAAVPANGPYTGFSGTHFFAAEDIDDGATRPDFQTLGYTIDIAGFTDLTFDGLFAAGGNAGTNLYDFNDHVRVRYSIDGGSFDNLLAFEANVNNTSVTDTQVSLDADFDGVGDGVFLPTATFTAFNGLAIAGTGNNLLLEIEVFAEGSGNEFAFDNLTINGTAATTPVPEPSTFIGMGVVGLMALGVNRKRKRQPVSVPAGDAG